MSPMLTRNCGKSRQKRASLFGAATAAGVFTVVRPLVFNLITLFRRVREDRTLRRMSNCFVAAVIAEKVLELLSRLKGSSPDFGAGCQP
jgi:hypothetical protein